VGEPGGIAFDHIQTEDLEEANAWAASIGCKSAEGLRLMHTATVVQKLRALLKGQNWEGMTRPPFGEILQRFQRQDWGGGTGAGGMVVDHRRRPSALHKSAGHKATPSTTPPDPDPLDRLAACAYQELQIISNEWELNALREAILGALTSGRPTGVVGDMCKDTIAVDIFEGCFIKAAQLCVETSHFGHLVKLANIVWAMRSHVIEDNWKGVSRAMRDIQQVVWVWVWVWVWLYRLYLSESESESGSMFVSGSASVSVYVQ
jgi:hypothetical protein